MRAVLLSVLIASALLCASEAQAINNSKGATGANHARAHRFATGTGVTVGILDTIPFGIQTPNHLGNRLLAQYDFINKTPSQLPDPLNNPNDDHERLAGHIIASDDSVYTGVAPAAQIYLAAIYDPDYQSRRTAPAWLNAHHGISIFSLSAGYGANANGSTSDAVYWDWLMHEKNVLLVSSAGNSGGQLVTPADSFNGIAVGAYDQATQARWNGSAYRLNGGAQGAEVRGKPDILAPGVWIGDGISYDGYYFLGTSFASPHVAGAAALLTDYASSHASSDQLDHRGMKAILLNSARKRQIAFPEVLSPQSSDSAAADATFDRDYLKCTAGGCALASSSSAALTATWTPAGWTSGGSTFSVDKPLDDEQGAGFLDATRALINLAGGSHAPGPVAGIGWDQDTIQPTRRALAAHLCNRPGAGRERISHGNPCLGPRSLWSRTATVSSTMMMRTRSASWPISTCNSSIQRATSSLSRSRPPTTSSICTFRFRPPAARAISNCKSPTTAAAFSPQNLHWPGGQAPRSSSPATTT